MKERIDGNNLKQRLDELSRFSFAYNDALYDLVCDFIVDPNLPEMDEMFSKKHIAGMPGGAGQNGSDTSAIYVDIPREVKPGFGQKLLRFLSPNETMIKIYLAGRVWRCTYQPEYEEFALLMKQQFKEQLASPLNIYVR